MTARFIALIALALALTVSALAQTDWTLRHQRAGGSDLWGIAAGGAGLVAVGTNGTILNSPDGVTWMRQNARTDAWLTAVTYGNGRYIAVGDGGLILISADGVSWGTVTHTVTTQRLNNVHFALNQFVVVGEGGTILTSPNGEAWTASNSGTTRWLRGLSFGAASEAASPSIFGTACWIATGQAGTLLISVDARTWRAIDAGTTADLESVTFVHGDHGHPIAGPGGGSAVFVIAGDAGVARRFTLSTSDSLLFTSLPFTLTPVDLGTNARVRALVSGPSTFARYMISASSFAEENVAPSVAVDETGGVASNYAKSATGTWVRTAVPTSAPLRAGAYAAHVGSFFFVGRDETIVQRDQVFNGRLGNIATRGFVEQGEKALVAGFVVRGSTPKRVLLRGIGPALGGFGLNNTLSRPVLTLFNANGAIIGSNAGWSSGPDAPPIAAAAEQAGAFALPAGSADAALLLTLTPGTYTAQIAGAAGSSGVALVEVYDLDAAVNGTARAINLSTRGQVASGENVLIAGLNVQGPQWRKFLVRGIGPGLAQFGVPNTLADPRLDLTLVRNGFDSRLGATTFTTNSLTMPEATRLAGAFPSVSGDQATLYVLPPGTYTFQVSSRSNASGVALVEIYDLGIAELVP